MTTQVGDLLRIRALDLIVSPRNQRIRPRKRIQEIGASLVAHGPLENLTVIPHVSRKKNAPAFEVIDGGTRLAGAHLKISTGELPDSFEFLCMVADAELAEEISIAANMHEPMHPADEFEAFKGMIDGGGSIEDVAARFGVTPLTVQRRLKLANVSPLLVKAYRDDEMTLEHLMAFAITDDHKAQEKVWNDVKDSPYQKAAPHIKKALNKSDAINAAHDRRALFIGLDAYEAAGGPVKRDLFSNGTGGFIEDEDLLERLANEKLAAAAEDVQAEGWAWVKTVDSWSYSDEAAFSKSQPKKRDLTEDEAELLADLRKQEEALDTKVAALDIEDDELVAELDAIRGKIETVEALQLTFTDRQKAKAGAVVTIHHDGSLKVVRGLIAPVERKAKAATAKDTGDGADASQAPSPDDAERPLPERLVMQLTAHRTAALQAAVANRPEVADALLLATMVPQTLIAMRDRYRYSSIVKVSLTDCRGIGRQSAEDLESSRAWTALQERIDYWQARLPAGEEHQPADLFAWCMELNLADRDDLRGLCVAMTINTIEQREDSAGHALAHKAMDAVELDMADWWQPTASSYLASVPKSRRMAAVREAVGERAAEEISSMKKDAMIGAAEEYLAGRRWLPTILRRPGAAAPEAPACEEPEADTPRTKAKASPAVRYRDSEGNAWTGRGKRPAWIEAALKSGTTLEELLVA